MTTTQFTGWQDGLFYVQGTMSKWLCEWADMRGLIRYPTAQHRNHALANGPRPASQFDQLPDEETTNP